MKVLEVKGKNSYLVKKGEINCTSWIDYRINGEKLSIQDKVDLMISKDDVFETRENRQIIKEYSRGDETLSIEEYKAKPQYHDEDSSDEDILRAIANKKELAGFKPVHEEIKFRPVEYEIVGVIEDTGSKFIECSIAGLYSSANAIYTVNGREAAVDEYLKLSEKYSDHARFSEIERGRKYLRFCQINGDYCFREGKPFSDHNYRSVFNTLEEAKIEEEWIREKVKKTVLHKVFKKDLTKAKKIQLLSNLKTVKSMKTRKSMIEVIDVMIDDLKEYLSKTK